MLRALRIRNLAVVENVEIVFSEGLNALTGSTGAGKSLILGAVNLLHGNRAGAEVIRKGEEKAEIEAVFKIEDPTELRDASGTPLGNEITLRREILAVGKSRAFVNKKSVPLRVLGDIASKLIEAQGQNEQLLLKYPENHVVYLDIFAEVDGLRSKYRILMQDLDAALKRLEEFNKRIELAKEKRELLEHRIEEIERAELKKGQKEVLENELRLLENAHEIIEAVSAACEITYEGDVSAVELISRSKKMLSRLADVDTKFSDYVSKLEEAEITLEETAREMRSRFDDLEFDPERFEIVQEKLAFIQSLERRYGMSLDEILEKVAEWQNELNAIDTEEEVRESIETEINGIAAELKRVALRLSDKRRKAAKRFDSSVAKTLERLMMPGVEFETRIRNELDDKSPIVVEGKRLRLFENGLDKVEFYAKTNKGENIGRVSEIASTGEISRIALAIRSILSRSRQGSTLVFDELDAGVGGDVAAVLADRLLSLSGNYQIIVITHMPQIASAAAHHLVVRKRIKAGRTFVEVAKVMGEEREREIARMLGGKGGSKKHLALAMDMLSEKRRDFVRP